MIPSLNDEQLVTAYHAASAFVFPSLYEGFGFPVIEAIACGTPAAVSNASCLPEVGGDTPEYFDPSSGRKMMESIESALQTNQTSDEAILRGQERVLESSWEEVAAQFLRVASHLNPAR